MQRRTMQSVSIWLAAMSWVAGVSVGVVALVRYNTTPAQRAAALADWPDVRGFAPWFTHNTRGPTLVVFAHPRCPCTRATLSELDRLLVVGHDKADVRVMFYRPSEEDASWSRTALWERAESLRGVSVFDDVDGALARAFGAAASGHAMLFDVRGRLLFSGGLTGARGHEGNNPGAASVRAILAGGSVAQPGAPVFGCPILGDESIADANNGVDP